MLLTELESALEFVGIDVGFGKKAIGIGALLKAMDGPTYKNDLDALKCAMADLSPKMTAGSIGMKLHHLRGRVIDGRKLDRIEHGKGILWTVIKAEQGGTTTTSGTSFHPLRENQGSGVNRDSLHIGTAVSPASPASPPDPIQGPGSQKLTTISALDAVTL